MAIDPDDFRWWGILVDAFFNYWEGERAWRIALLLWVAVAAVWLVMGVSIYRVIRQL
jgi:hypothetical protein